MPGYFGSSQGMGMQNPFSIFRQGGGYNNNYSPVMRRKSFSFMGGGMQQPKQPQQQPTLPAPPSQTSTPQDVIPDSNFRLTSSFSSGGVNDPNRDEILRKVGPILRAGGGGGFYSSFNNWGMG